ncbi:OLC1v1008475C1 [Oldenlandia corymbosa var. corymbosa]|uniref:OLC1v1008475C1 n=1 Tax=Oldenlandia corymbosa var. corymbosa TaxID=529605 RepID=A0AAV1DLS1_OLDCO|nr:OLC1v1008475C1 [Oldenlandia corymbosa var. corymbosa]
MDTSWDNKIRSINRILRTKQLTVYIPQVDLSSRFAVLDDLKEDPAFENNNNSNGKKEEQPDGMVESEVEIDSDKEENFDGKNSILETVNFNVIRHIDEYEGNAQPDRGATDDFNQWINSCNLTELSPLGNIFTWSGNQQNGKVLKKLDRVLFSQEWMDFFQASSIHNLNKTTSDHAPLLHQFRVEMETRPSIFRLQKMWMRRDSFLDVVKNNWELPHHMIGMIGFSMKLRRLKERLKD